MLNRFPVCLMVELFLDGLVGPTHHFGGLSKGNLASMDNKGIISSPKKAALEGLKKMSFVKSLGVPQAVLPPHSRPDLKTLEALGWTLETAPIEVILMVSSASSMWAANSGVITPSCDTPDGKVHITPANLIHTFHRSLEVKRTLDIFEDLFPKSHFVIHPPLPSHPSFSDEGAANHVRLNGMHLFVYSPKNGRQSKQASMAIARSHGILDKSIFLEQTEEAVTAGVFHNDVISFGCESLFIAHEKAFASFKNFKDFDLFIVTEQELSLNDAVSTYFFNSQLISKEGKMHLIATKQCENHPGVQKILQKLPVDQVYYVDLNESMRNGGGPSCLKISFPITKEELQSLNPRYLLTDRLEKILTEWIEYYYEDSLPWTTLKDPIFIQKNQEALVELSKII